MGPVPWLTQSRTVSACSTLVPEAGSWSKTVFAGNSLLTS